LNIFEGFFFIKITFIGYTLCARQCTICKNLNIYVKNKKDIFSNAYNVTDTMQQIKMEGQHIKTYKLGGYKMVTRLWNQKA
jgi:hypothetical protein